MFLRDKNQSARALLSILDTIGGSVRQGAGWIMPGSRRHISRTKYSGEQLREIRARKGVGRPPEVTLLRGLIWRGWKIYPSYCASRMGGIVEQPNFYEWKRKPRRKPRGVAA